MSERSKAAFIFPAFVHSYPEDLFIGLPGAEEVFHALLVRAGDHLSNELSAFDRQSNTFLDNELLTQYITYCFSCSVDQAFKSQGIHPGSSAGYSMGIYASLVNSEVIAYTDGLDLITKAFESIQHCLSDTKYGMASIIGLSRSDLLEQVEISSLKVEITNQNSEFAFVLSGVEKDLDLLLEKASEEGALHVRKMNTSIPYHSSILNNCSYRFGKFVESVPFNFPRYRIISLIDQKIMETPDQLKAEVTRNLFTPLDWYQTQLTMIRSGITEFVECGIDKGLIKNSKFIDGDFSFLTPAGYLKKIGPLKY